MFWSKIWKNKNVKIALVSYANILEGHIRIDKFLTFKECKIILERVPGKNSFFFNKYFMPVYNMIIKK